jgi:hypothetical protein
MTQHISFIPVLIIIGLIVEQSQFVVVHGSMASHTHLVHSIPYYNAISIMFFFFFFFFVVFACKIAESGIYEVHYQKGMSPAELTAKNNAVAAATTTTATAAAATTNTTSSVMMQLLKK